MALTYEVEYLQSHITKNLNRLHWMALLTVSQQTEQHLHLRQWPQAGEVWPLGATSRRWVRPASCLRFGQDFVTKTIVRPPSIDTLCGDVLPILCGRTESEELESYSLSHRRHCCCPVVETHETLQNEREIARSKDHSPEAVQLLGQRSVEKNKSVQKCFFK